MLAVKDLLVVAQDLLLNLRFLFLCFFDDLIDYESDEGEQDDSADYRSSKNTTISVIIFIQMLINTTFYFSSDLVGKLLDVSIDSLLQSADILGADYSIKFFLAHRCSHLNFRKKVIVEQFTNMKVDISPILKTFISSLNSIIVVLH